MRTVVEPQQHIAALWSKPQVIDGETFRMMRYVLRVDHESKVLLHNVVTGQLVILDHDEANMVEVLPKVYSPIMEAMVSSHFLVPENYDEHTQVKTMRSIIRKLGESQGTRDITSYTILTTTACNARCYYCFEHNVRTMTMSEKTANDVIDFIAAHCGNNKKVSITWFGGEPTLALNRIDQICLGLRSHDIDYMSKITTNGYLLDEYSIHKAKDLWHLKSVNIAMDGTEKKYNSIKSYVNPKDNPYQRVMRNIGFLLKEGIHINLRMNFDMSNYDEFRYLVQELIDRFGKTPLLNVSVHQINGDNLDCEGIMRNYNEEWFSQKIPELNDIAREAGLFRKKVVLPSLVSLGCKASLGSTVTITPEGNLVRCPEQFGDDQITGNVRDGITNEKLVDSWKQLIEYQKCGVCEFYPHCIRIRNCNLDDRCCYRREYKKIYSQAVIQKTLM